MDAIADSKVDAIDKLVGARLRSRRALQGLSQEQLGGLIGVTFQQVQKYESGKNRISASRLVLAARALACQVVFFFEGIEAGDEDFAEVPLSLDAVKLGRRFDSVRDPHIREIMVRTLSAFDKAPQKDAVR